MGVDPEARRTDGAGGSSSELGLLSERLGLEPGQRAVVINADDLGQCHAANQGVYRSLRSGIATSASLMVPCAWSRHAVSMYEGEDVGVHLTLNAEYDLYRWTPITQAPSLLDGDGGFPRTVGDTWDHADLDEVRRECRAQVERALSWGIDVTHLDSHMGTLQMRPEFFDVYLDLAVEFQLPIRLSGASSERLAGFPFRSLALEEGVWFCDWFVWSMGIGSRDSVMEIAADLRPGVTELYVHPALDAPELRAFDPRWEGRVDDLDLVSAGSELDRVLQDEGVRRVGWREIRDAMRSASGTDRVGELA
jgi:predicted glycoside hydrolase/deacetylase ChbG (UPF0249 family)